MWHNHLFSHRSKITERAVGVDVGGNKKGGGGWSKFEKGGRQYRS